MKTRRRQNKKRVGRKTKGGGWMWPFPKNRPFTNLEGEEEEEYEKPVSAKVEYDPFDPVEKQKIIDAYAKVGVEHKKEIDTNDATTKDATKLLMDYKVNPSCIEYDTYVQDRANYSNLKNYKKVLDTKLNNLSQNRTMRQFKEDITGLQKCTSFYRNPFRPTKAGLARQELIKVGEKQEMVWNNNTEAAGGNRKSKRYRKNKKRTTRRRR